MKPSKEAADDVRRLLADGRTQPFWTTTAGFDIRPFIKIECDDLKLMHALDEFLRASVREAQL